MKPLLSKAASIAAGVVALLVGCALLGLGLWIVAFLAMFGLAALGIALLAAPFVARRVKGGDAFVTEIMREHATAG